MKAKKILAVLLTAAQLFGAAAFASADEPADVRLAETAFTPTVTDAVTAEPALIPAESGFDHGKPAYPEIPAEELTVEIPAEMPLPVLPGQDLVQDPAEREAALEKLKEAERQLHGGTVGCDVYIPPFGDLSRAKDLLSSAFDLQNLYSDSVLVYSTEDAVQAIRDAMVAHQDHVLVEIEHVNGGPADDWYAAEYDAWYDYVDNNVTKEVLSHTGVPTEGDYLRSQSWFGFIYGTSYASVNNHAVTYISGSFEYQSTADDEAQMDIRVPEVISSFGFDAQTTDFQKVAVIHDYICSHVTYDYEHLDDTSYLKKYSAAAALLDGTAVCNGYAALFYRLCLEVGVDARYAKGEAGGYHAWNIVNPGDGLYYYIDTTWDAGDPVSYRYFLKGSDNFCTDHANDEDTWEAFGSQYTISASDCPMSLSVYSGSCGDNLTWTVYSNGLLEITGTGPMYDYAGDDSNRAPWHDIRASVNNLSLSDGVTYIGSCAFLHTYNLVEISSFPDSLEEIGPNAFYYCTSLDGTLFFPDTLDYLDFHAFQYCTSLTSAAFIGNAPVYFGTGVFDSCADGFTVNCYENCADSFTSDSAYDADAGTWHGYPLVILSQPGPVDNVVAEGQCGPDVYWTLFDDGLLELNGTGPMYDYSYNDQSYYPYRDQIHSVRICEGVTTVGASAFLQYYGINQLYDLPSTLTSIGDEAFRYNYFGGTVRIPAAVSYIGREAFSLCTNVTEYVVASSNPYFASINGCIYTKDYSELVQYPCGRTGELSLHNNVKVIRTHACAGTWGRLTGNLNLPEGLEVLEDSAFWRCTGLTGELVLPSTLREIGEWAFMGCPFTGDLIIPAGVQFIGPIAFSECDGITSAVFEGPAPSTSELSEYLQYGIFGNRSDTDFTVYCYAEYADTFTSGDHYDDSAGTWNGYPLVIYNDAPVSIDVHPEDQTVLPGETAVFSVSVSGGCEPYRYQWRYRAGPNGTWTDVSAASGRTDTYSLVAQARHNGYQYFCIVTDAYGDAVNSDIATLTVTSPLTITSQPENQNVTPGSTATFSVSVSGGIPPYAFQWQYRTSSSGTWTNVSAASGKTPNYTFTVQARHNGYQYRCKITDKAGSSVITNIVTLHGSPLTINSQPQDLTVSAGQTASFSVTASGGTAPYSYQWQSRTSPSGSWANVASASGKTDTLTFTAQTRHNGFQYRCRITDTAGQSVESSYATLTVGGPLIITSQPADQTVSAGEKASFTVTPSGGTAPYSYQWQYRKSASGAWTAVFTAGKAQTYSVTAALRHNGYQYRCMVTDSAGQSVTSSIATLTVGSSLIITEQPQDRNVQAGDTTFFSVTVSGGTAPYSYQWQYRKSASGAWTNVSAYSGRTATYKLTVENRHNGFQYRCAVTDAAGQSVTSSIVTLTVRSLTISSQPSDVTVAAGKTAVFTVSVSGGTAPYSYQWQYLTPTASAFVNVTAASGKTASYSLTVQARHDGYRYRCIVTDAAGQSVISKDVRLTVSGAPAALAITAQPVSQVVTAGTSVTFSVGVKGGTAPYSYQWQYLKPGASAWANVTAASGKTASYTLTAQTRHDVYTYRCTVTDSAGQSVVSSAAVLMVNAGKSTTPPDIDPDFGADFPVLDLTPEEEALWDLGELNEADLKVLAPVETSSVGLNLSASAEIITFTADFGDESSAFFGDLSVYDFDPAADTAEFDDTVSE